VTSNPSSHATSTGSLTLDIAIMPPPSPLKIATQAVERLLKEETFHRKDLVEQEGNIKKLQDQISSQSADLDQNAEFYLRQQRQALEQIKGVFAPLQARLLDGVQNLEGQIAIATGEGTAPEEELSKAKEVLELGKNSAESTESPRGQKGGEAVTNSVGEKAA